MKLEKETRLEKVLDDIVESFCDSQIPQAFVLLMLMIIISFTVVLGVILVHKNLPENACIDGVVYTPVRGVFEITDTKCGVPK